MLAVCEDHDREPLMPEDEQDPRTSQDERDLLPALDDGEPPTALDEAEPLGLADEDPDALLDFDDDSEEVGLDSEILGGDSAEADLDLDEDELGPDAALEPGLSAEEAWGGELDGELEEDGWTDDGQPPPHEGWEDALDLSEDEPWADDGGLEGVEDSALEDVGEDDLGPLAGEDGHDGEGVEDPSDDEEVLREIGLA